MNGGTCSVNEETSTITCQCTEEFTGNDCSIRSNQS